MWQGIDTPLDDAFVDLSGRRICSKRKSMKENRSLFIVGSTYFFKGLDFWRLNDTSMESAMDYPRSINTEWLYCDKPRSTSSLLISLQSTLILPILLLLLFRLHNYSSL